MGERPPARPLYSAYRVPSSNPTSPTTRAPPTSLELASTSADGLNGSLHASYSGESSASSSNVLSTSSRATAGAPASDAPASSSGALLSADRSCDRCRARRVRCDRSHPFCQRCVKGNQECNYPSITSWEHKSADEPRSRVVELEAKLASVQKQLRTSLSQNQAQSPTHAPPISFDELGAASTSLSTAQIVYNALFPNPTSEQMSALNLYLAAQLSRVDLLHNIDHRLASQGLANSLALSLMEACCSSSCSQRPALRLASEMAPRLRGSMHALNPADQLAVAVLCSLGARTSPHSAIVGAGPLSLDDTAVHSAAYAAAGARRETACRALEKRASDLAWTGGLLQQATWENLRVLCALSELLAYEELRPAQARFFLRNSVGLWQDLRAEARPGDVELARVLGESLLAADALVAPHSGSPLLLNDALVQEQLVPLGVTLPDVVNGTRLSFILDSLLTGQQLAPNTLTIALETIADWVSSCYRRNAVLIAAPHHDVPALDSHVRQLFSLIDEIHASNQRLQQIIINTLPPSLTDDDLSPLLQRTVRETSALMELVFHIHRFLEQVDTSYDTNGDLARAKHESELRVRMCLKLAAFCASLYMSGADKHMLFHLVQTLDVLDNWPAMVSQRTGMPGGPVAPNYEATPQELSWLSRALELATWFTPRAAVRLQELSAEQGRWMSQEAANAIPMARAPQPDSQNYVSRPSTGSSTFSVYDGDSHRATTAHSLQYSQQAPHHHLTAHDSYFLDPRHMGHPMGVEGEQRVQLDSSGSGETGSMDEDSTASTREG